MSHVVARRRKTSQMASPDLKRLDEGFEEAEGSGSCELQMLVMQMTLRSAWVFATATIQAESS